MKHLHNLIKEAKQNFKSCLILENLGHFALRKALLICINIIQQITMSQLNKLLDKHNITNKQKICEKDKAKAVLWLTIGKPNSDNPLELERQKARIRMYARVLNKLISQNIDIKTAEMFLKQYGVYAIANLNKLENKDKDDEFDEDDTLENGCDDSEDDDQKTDHKSNKSSQLLKALKDNGIDEKPLILIKSDKKVYICTKIKATKSVINFIKEQKLNLGKIKKN